MGYGSRKEVKPLFKKGKVFVNDQIVKDPSIKVDPEKEKVQVDGQEVEYKPYIYVMMNKPKGVICATHDKLHRTVIDLLDEDLQSIYAPFPVGRLDKDTEGLLLLTNDGDFSHALMSPRKHVTKQYWAKIRGRVNEEDQKAFREGVKLDDGYMTKPGELVIVDSNETSEILLTISEGKFHQVKRMFLARDKEVTELKRLKVGALELDSNLKLGDYRELTEQEKQLLVGKR